MGSSNYYGIDEGSEVYKENSDNVIRTHPAEPINKVKKDKKDKKNKKKDNGERRTLRQTINVDQTVTDNSTSNSLDMIFDFTSGLIKLSIFLLPFILIMALFFPMTKTIIDSANSTESQQMMSNVTSALGPFQTLVETMPFFMFIIIFFLLFYIFFKMMRVSDGL